MRIVQGWINRLLRRESKGGAESVGLMFIAIAAIVVAFVWANINQTKFTRDNCMSYLSGLGYTVYASPSGTFYTNDVLPNTDSIYDIGGTGNEYDNGYFDDLWSNFHGNLSGNVTGNVTGNLWGNVTGISSNATSSDLGKGYPITRSATYVVAASNALASSKAQADYVCDGTADNIQIQAAINALPATGGLVQLSEGQFNIAASINVTVDGLRLVGMGSGGSGAVSTGVTTLYLADNANCNMIQNADAITTRLVFIQHLVMYGNDPNNTSGNGIQADYLRIGNYNAGLFDVIIHYFDEHGIYGNVNPNFLYASHFFIRNNGEDGIDIKPQGMILSLPNWIASNGGYGIFCRGGTDHVIDLYLESNGLIGGFITGVDRSTIRIWTRENGHEGVGFSSSDENLISVWARDNCQTGSDVSKCEIWLYDFNNNNLTAFAKSTVATTDGIYWQGHSNLGNSVSAVAIGTRYGMSFGNSGTPNFTGTVISGSYVYGVTLSVNNGSGVALPAFRGNTGYVTENSGTFSITANTWGSSINHGLSTNATSVTFGLTSNCTTGVYVLPPITTTAFSVNISALQGSNITGYWRAVVGSGN